jgi:hypothetical protein
MSWSGRKLSPVASLEQAGGPGTLTKLYSGGLFFVPPRQFPPLCNTPMRTTTQLISAMRLCNSNETSRPRRKVIERLGNKGVHAPVVRDHPFHRGSAQDTSIRRAPTTQRVSQTRLKRSPSKGSQWRPNPESRTIVRALRQRRPSTWYPAGLERRMTTMQQGAPRSPCTRMAQT